MSNLVINVDKDVAKPGSKRKSRIPQDDPRIAELKALELNDSFFIAKQERKDTRPLVNLGKKIGVFLLVRQVEVDEIYQCAGCRYWVVTEAEMPSRKAKGEEQREPAAGSEELEEEVEQEADPIEDDDDDL